MAKNKESTGAFAFRVTELPDNEADIEVSVTSDMKMGNFIYWAFTAVIAHILDIKFENSLKIELFNEFKKIIDSKISQLEEVDE